MHDAATAIWPSLSTQTNSNGLALSHPSPDSMSQPDLTSYSLLSAHLSSSSMSYRVSGPGCWNCLGILVYGRFSNRFLQWLLQQSPMVHLTLSPPTSSIYHPTPSNPHPLVSTHSYNSMPSHATPLFSTSTLLVSHCTPQVLSVSHQFTFVTRLVFTRKDRGRLLAFKSFLRAKRRLSTRGASKRHCRHSLQA